MNRQKFKSLLPFFCVVVFILAWVGYFACVCHRRSVKITERKAFLDRFGIVSDGRQDFVGLPSFLPHAVPAAELGRRLFQDRRIACSPRRVCGACHLLNEGGTDGKRHRGVMTRPALNAVFAPVFLHDASISNMTDLVRCMLEDPAFCGGGSVSNLVQRMSADPRMVERFQFAYSDGVTVDNLLDAFSQYLRTLLTTNLPFDHWCGGRTDAFSAIQEKGAETFKVRGCLACHDGPALGTLKVSEGRKVPALRGISQRRVFLSDASQTDLGAVFTRMPVGELEAEERIALVAFLKSL